MGWREAEQRTGWPLPAPVRSLIFIFCLVTAVQAVVMADSSAVWAGLNSPLCARTTCVAAWWIGALPRPGWKAISCFFPPQYVQGMERWRMKSWGCLTGVVTYVRVSAAFQWVTANFYMHCVCLQEQETCFMHVSSKSCYRIHPCGPSFFWGKRSASDSFLFSWRRMCCSRGFCCCLFAFKALTF